MLRLVNVISIDTLILMKYLLFFIILSNVTSSIAQTSSPSKHEDSLKSVQIISKYLNALGDSESIISVKRTLIGKAQGMDSEMRILQKSPDKFSVESFLNGKLISKQLSNDNQFVILVQNYQIPVDQATKDIGIFEWSLIPETRLRELNINLVYKGVIIDNGSQLNLIEYTFPSGHKILNYFDEQNGLKVKTSREQVSAIGKVAIISSFSDYRDVKGFKFPFEIIQSMAGIEQKMIVTLLEVNVELGESLFKIEK